MSSVPDGPRLRVVPIYPDVTKPLEKWPFACVITQGPNEQIYDTTRPCLHVFCLPGFALEFADGLYAMDKTLVSLEPGINWPVLSTALTMPVKAYSKALMPKEDETGFQRVMIWHRFGRMNPRLPDDAEGHALRAYMAATKWNGWVSAAKQAKEQRRKTNWGFDEALRDMSSNEEWNQIVKNGGQFAEGENLRAFCKRIGLRMPNTTDFTTPNKQLVLVLAEAYKWHKGERDKLMNSQARPAPSG